MQAWPPQYSCVLQRVIPQTGQEYGLRLRRKLGSFQAPGVFRFKHSIPETVYSRCRDASADRSGIRFETSPKNVLPLRLAAKPQSRDESTIKAMENLAPPVTQLRAPDISTSLLRSAVLHARARST